MVQVFTHRKRSYVGCDRNRMDFKITVDHINFSMNKYFLANSHYVIFRKENKSKQFVSKSRVLTAAELKHVPVNEKIKFRSCLMQDLAHRYLEKYISKTKRFLVRQVTVIDNEELYVNVGYFELQLDIYAMMPSGQDVVVKFVDPGGMAAGTVALKVEHEPRTHMHNYIPNFHKSLKKHFPKVHIKKNVAAHTRLDSNRELLDFVKQQKLAHHRSFRYDGTSDEDGSETSSESGDYSDHSAHGDANKVAATNNSFEMNRTGVPWMAIGKKEMSVYLDPNLFTFEDFDSGTPTKCNEVRESSFRKANSLSENHVVSFDVLDIPFCDTTSTLSHSSGKSRGHEEVVEEVAVQAPSPRASQPPRHHKVTLPTTLTRTGYPGESYKHRADAALEDDLQEDLQVVRAVVEEWEDPADFDKLPPSLPGTRSPSPVVYTALASQPVHSHNVHRSTSDSSTMAQMALNMQSEDECDVARGPVPMDPHDVSYAAPDQAQRVVEPTRVAEPAKAAERHTHAHAQGHLERQHSHRSEQRHAERHGEKSVGSARSPSPAVRLLVPVRLTQQQSATVEMTERSAAVASSAQVHASPRSTADVHAHTHAHTHHRAASTGDMYAGIGHRQSQPDPVPVSPNVSVKELRRNYERPPMAKDNSAGSDNCDPYKLSLKNLSRTPEVPALNLSKPFQRSYSVQSSSTLSTHDNLPPQKHHSAAPSKVLVPVRLHSAAQELAYQEDRYRSQARDVPPPRTLHRAASGVPTASRPMDVAPEHRSPGGRPHRSDPPYREGHSLHSGEHGPSRSRDFERSVSQPQPQYEAPRHHLASRGAEEESRSHLLHRAHSMAPPIRLAVTDYLPPTYERYVEVPHQPHPSHHQHPYNGAGQYNNHTNHNHNHNNNHNNNYTNVHKSSSSSPHDAYYAQTKTGHTSPERVHRGVYA